MAEQEDIVRKVRLLLALGKSPNAFEAANAVGKAQELMLQYGIEFEAIQMEDKKSPVVETALGLEDQRLATWKRQVVESVVHTSLVDGFWQHAWDKGDDFILIGRAADVEVAGYTIAFLFGELSRLAEQEWRRAYKSGIRGAKLVPIRNSFLVGAANGVWIQLKRAYDAQFKQAAVNALIVLRDAEIDEVMKSHNLRQGKRHDARVTDHAAYGAGLKAGLDLNIRPGVQKGQEAEVLLLD